jgi:hypothetical protein
MMRAFAAGTGIALGLLAAAAIPATAAESARSGRESQTTTTRSVFIERAVWVRTDKGRVLVVYPTDALRDIGGSHSDGEAAWAELLDRYGNTITQNVPGMKDQFICHVEHSWLKQTYNLDPWRPDLSYARTIRDQCNPGGDL